MSLPVGINKSPVIASGTTKKAYARRKAPPALEKAGTTSRRAPMPLPPRNQTLHKSNTQPFACQSLSDQESNNQTKRATPSNNDPTHYTEKQKAHMYTLVTDENNWLKQKSSRMSEVQRKTQAELQAAKQLIEQMRQENRQIRDAQTFQPIGRPCITKEESSEIRLISTREILGLQLNDNDFVNRRWTNRGMLKDKSWKLLLQMAREIVTWGIQELELDPAPVWKKLKKTQKRDLVNEFERRVKGVPCLKALFFHSSRWDVHAGPEIFLHSWPLKEMIVSTIDNIKDTNKRQRNIKLWCLKAMKEDPGPGDIRISSWPPSHPPSFVTSIIHHPSEYESNVRLHAHRGTFQKAEGTSNHKRKRVVLTDDTDDDDELETNHAPPATSIHKPQKVVNKDAENNHDDDMADDDVDDGDDDDDNDDERGNWDEDDDRAEDNEEENQKPEHRQNHKGQVISLEEEDILDEALQHQSASAADELNI